MGEARYWYEYSGVTKDIDEIMRVIGERAKGGERLVGVVHGFHVKYPMPDGVTWKEDADGVYLLFEKEAPRQPKEIKTKPIIAHRP